MDETTKKQVEEMIDAAIKKAVAFVTKKYGDTPTDDLQLTPKKYVDRNVGLPAGSNQQVQFNDGGVLAGDANFLWDKTNRMLTFANNLDIVVATDLNFDIASGDIIISNNNGVGRLVLSTLAGQGLRISTGSSFYVDLTNVNSTADHEFEFPNADVQGVGLSGTGAGAPGTTPGDIGLVYIDTTGGKWYGSVGTSSSADWKILN